MDDVLSETCFVFLKKYRKMNFKSMVRFIKAININIYIYIYIYIYICFFVLFCSVLLCLFCFGLVLFVCFCLVFVFVVGIKFG